MFARPLILMALTALLACDGKSEDTDTGEPVVGSPDDDGDGYTVEDGDCDDGNSTINPSAVEVCDSIDNDCDEEVDEGVTTTYYADADGDGFGDNDTPTESCEAPGGYVIIGNDCDDDDSSAYPGGVEVCDGVDNNCDAAIDEGVTDTFYADADADLYGDPNASTEACAQPKGYVSDDTDCDDTSGASYPGAVEVCDNNDNDCDKLVDEDVTTTYYVDVDADGYGLADDTTEDCTLPEGFADVPGDCDDTADAINPAATEVCDSVDNDCDTLVDDADDSIDASTQSSWYADSDGDGFGDASATTLGCLQPTGHVSDSTDCDDTEGSVYPAAAEVCDGVYNDCDDSSYSSSGAPDEEADLDGDGYVECAYASSSWLGDSVDGGGDCDDTAETVHPGATELCDGIYNDCDDSSYSSSGAPDDESDLDGDGYVECAHDSSTWTGASVDGGDDCDDDDPDSYPGAAELCDGVYNDCDDGSYSSSGAPDEESDLDSDGYVECAYSASDWRGDSVGGGDDCDDGDSASYPDAMEVCDGVDNDCNGDIDDGTALGSDASCPAYSCLEIIDNDSSAADGTYYIDPDEDGSETEVYCDMTTDSGGYTYYKVNYGSATYAATAESTCDAEGMQLFIPRTEDHQLASVDYARDSSIDYDAGSWSYVYYMYLLGIYPTSTGNRCTYTGLNSDDCTNWQASDGGPYYVGSSTSISEPNGDNSTYGSMYYRWNDADDSINWYNDISGNGYSSQYFMCDVGDKWGDGVDRGD